MKDNYHGEPFNEISRLSHGLGVGYPVPFGSLGQRRHQCDPIRRSGFGLFVRLYPAIDAT